MDAALMFAPVMTPPAVIAVPNTERTASPANQALRLIALTVHATRLSANKTVNVFAAAVMR